MTERVDRAKRYHDAIRDVLLHQWDPIGVADVLEAQDEYDAYVAEVYGMLVRHEPRHKLAEHLWSIETKNMGLHGNRQRTEGAADALIRIREDMETGA